MDIKLDKEQFKLLVRLVMLGGTVEAAAREARGEGHDDVHLLEDHLFAQAGEQDFLSPRLLGEIERTMREYEDDTFWLKLETELGLRDFYETLNFKELRAIKEGEEPLPDAVEEFYEKYAEEFDRHRTDRLRIVSGEKE